MKKLLFCLLLYNTAQAQTDSTQIVQTITLAQKYHVYILGNLNNWGTPEAINYINQVRGQYDTTNENHPITVNVPSGFIRDAYQQMSFQPEGQATQYNDLIKNALGPQVTNDWLEAQLNSITNSNWNAREQRLNQTSTRLLQVEKVNIQ